MQGSNLNKLVFGILMALLGVWAALNVITARGNILGELYFYLMIISGVFGLMMPRPAFFYLIFLTAYVDFFKRLMVFGDNLSLLDLYWVLGIAPATLAGITVSVLFGALQGRFSVSKGQNIWNISVIVFTALAIVAAALAGGMAAYRQLGDAVNIVLYISMLVVVPVLFPTPAELAALLRTILLIFVPSALYMWHHGIFGVRDWEIAYLRLGASSEIRMLYERFFRPFGTMNSASAASMIFAVFSMFALLVPWRAKDEDGSRPLGNKGAFLKLAVFPLFLVAAIFTYTRTGWVLGLACFGVMICFRHKLLTQLCYVASGVVVAGLIFGASWMLKNEVLREINRIIFNTVPASEKMLGSFSLLTFNSRLRSFEHLTSNSDIWTPFGFKVAGLEQSLVYTEGSGIYVHDAITDSLMKFGYVPLAILLLFGIWSVIKIHSTVFQQTSPLAKGVAVAGAAGAFSFAVAGLSSWSVLYTFPVNCYLWLCCGIVVSLHFYARAEQAHLRNNDVDSEQNSHEAVLIEDESLVMHK